jgi:hypothetical protein
LKENDGQPVDCVAQVGQVVVVAPRFIITAFLDNEESCQNAMEIIVKVVRVSSQEESLKNDYENAQNKFISVSAPVETRAIEFALEIVVDVQVFKVIEIDVIKLVKTLRFVNFNKPLLLYHICFNINGIITLQTF